MNQKIKNLAGLLLKIKNESLLKRFYQLQDKERGMANELWARGFLIFVENQAYLSLNGQRLIDYSSANPQQIKKYGLVLDYIADLSKSEAEEFTTSKKRRILILADNKF